MQNLDQCLLHHGRAQSAILLSHIAPNNKQYQGTGERCSHMVLPELEHIGCSHPKPLGITEHKHLCNTSVTGNQASQLKSFT